MFLVSRTTEGGCGLQQNWGRDFREKNPQNKTKVESGCSTLTTEEISSFQQMQRSQARGEERKGERAIKFLAAVQETYHYHMI